MGRLFGTDGVRGLANKEITCDLAFKLGQAGAYILTMEKKKPKILIGRDTRISGDMLEAAMVAGICSVGAEAVILGVIPTPAVAYLTRTLGADAGVVISASHNSMEYNGIKFFDGKGFKLPDELEDKIEALILDENESIPVPIGNEVGRCVRVQSAVKDYISFLKSTVDVDFNGLTIALDCANGASYEAAPQLFEELGAKTYAICNTPDGTNINKLCGSTYPENLQKLVLETKADVGLAFDGDADRLIAVDDQGRTIDGDQVLMICALDMIKKGKLRKNTIVATVMSNLGLDIAARKAGIKVEKTRVGDRYVLEKMLESDFNFGGEQSGHIIFRDYNTTGDGLLTAVQMLAVMKRNGKMLSDLASVMQKLPQVLVNAKVSPEGKKGYMDDPAIREAIEKIEAQFNDNGRVLIRPSGTEPLVRVMIEGPDQRMIEDQAKMLAKLIEERFKQV